jgi:hypothetical protein
MTRRHPEDDLQRTVIDTLRLSPGLVVIAIPNGGKRGKIEAARLKGLGVAAGVSDLMVFWAPAKVAMIELKAPGLVTGKHDPLDACSEPQQVWYLTMRTMGHFITVCDSVEMVEAFLRGCGAPVCTHTEPGKLEIGRIGE